MGRAGDSAHLEACGPRQSAAPSRRPTSVTCDSMRLTIAGPRFHAAVALATVALSSSACHADEINFGDIDLCAGTSQVVASVPVQPSQVSLRVGFTAQLQAWPL